MQATFLPVMFALLIAGAVARLPVVLMRPALPDPQPVLVAPKLAASPISAEAEAWLVAAEGGNAVAQLGIGVRYWFGDGVPQDMEAALHWIHTSADHGVADAQHLMGLLHQEGLVVPQDLAAAIAWHLKAAEQGHAGARLVLERMGMPRT